MFRRSLYVVWMAALTSCARLQAMDAAAAEEAELAPADPESILEGPDALATEPNEGSAEPATPQAGMIDAEVSYEAPPEPEAPPPPKPKKGQKPPTTVKKADLVAEGDKK
jgi:hypothetical protein